MTPITVEVALVGDIDSLVALDRECFPPGDPNREPAGSGEIEQGVRSGHMLVVRGPARGRFGEIPIVAFLQYCPLGEGQFHILGVGVAKEHRGHRLAQDLVDYLAAWCETHFATNWTLTATTSAANLPMLSTFLRAGFIADGFMEAYYGDNHGRLYLRAPYYEAADPRTRLLVPVQSITQLASVLGGREYVLVNIVSMPSGQCFELARRGSADMSLQATEASVSMSLTGTLLAAMTFLLGSGLTGAARFPSDILAHLVLSLVAVLMAVLVYGSSSAELARFRIGDFNRHMIAGNALSETGGVYSFLHLLPVALIRITESKSAGIITAVGTALTLVWYHRSGFAIVPRHPLHPIPKGIIVWYMTLSPILGLTLFLLLGSSSVWAVTNLIMLGLTTVTLLRSRETFPGPPRKRFS